MKIFSLLSSSSAAALPVIAIIGAFLGDTANGLSVGGSASGSQGLVNTIVDSTTVTVHSHTVYGLVDQWGLFFGGSSAIGLDQGAILSSSVITGAVAPYPLDHVMTGHNTSGNVMLSSILPPTNNATYDAVTIRLVFTCKQPSTRVQFRYVFGSNEFAYDPAIGNDAFGAFLNGGAPANNIAKMCLSSGPLRCPLKVPVTASNVFTSDSYVDNIYRDRDTEMMGFTTPLLATGPAREDFNKIFITLADVHDGSTGSFLFIERGSFKCLP